MRNGRSKYVENILLPCVIFSLVTGVFTGTLIFGFKAAAAFVMELSSDLYAFVREQPKFLPLLLLGVALLGLCAALILRWEPNCRGGGIPTAIGQLRGLLSFRWLRTVMLVFVSSLLTYLCGIPLGNEGPGVQMGTCVGRGAARMLGRKNLAWDLYVITGGACAGFAAATGAPLTGILFAFEEAHRRFSPMIFMVSSATVVFGSITNEILSDFWGMDGRMFSFSINGDLPLKYLWAALIVGLVCGLAAVLFTKLYRVVWNLILRLEARIPLSVMVVAVFVLVAVIGFFGSDALGSGHEIIHRLADGQGLWWLILLWFAVRAILLIAANNVGVTGGLFVPSLAFGAMIGYLCSRGLIFLGFSGEDYVLVLTTVGMAAFLGASSRIPLTAIAFSVEALCGGTNLLPMIAGVTFAYLVIEVVGIEGFNETVIESRVAGERKGKSSLTVEEDLVVQPGAFVVGKEVRNILWPPSFVVLSVHRNPDRKDRQFGGMEAGDILHVHYTTYDPVATEESLAHLVGKQETKRECSQ